MTKHRIVEQYLTDSGKLCMIDEQGEHHVAPTEPVHLWRWRSLAIWVAAFSVVTILAIHAARHQASENHHRINEIQSSRVYSCRKTYEGIRDVFKPYFPKGKKATPRQKANLVQFNNRVNYLKKQCIKQTKAKVTTDGKSLDTNGG